MNRLISLLHTSRVVIKDEGLTQFAQIAGRKIKYRIKPSSKPRYMRDVLFIVGPHLPQVKRYRVDHQVEQIRAGGMTADIIFDHALTPEDIKYYRGFVFCRYPHTDKAQEFIRVAKSYNKTIIFEIDGLVFDMNFTNTIQTVKDMTVDERELYDSGVKRCQQTLQLCDYAITTTEPLANELRKYDNIKDVFINRNVASDAMVSFSKKAIKEIKRSDDVVTIGYFSGSITHNEDFESILPTIIEIMKKYDNVQLRIAGILDEQSELRQFGERVSTTGFVDWKELPGEIRKCDINLAPFAKETIFNEAKSEIKWLESALVKTMTIASDYGAFRTEIEDGVTGILASEDEWFTKIEEMILQVQRREEIARNAYDEATSRRTTLATAKPLTDWLMQTFSKNVVFAVPSVEISGGVNVVLKHADILRKHGFDVTILNTISQKMHTAESRRLDDLSEILQYKTVLEQRIDEMVATLWATVPMVRKVSNVTTKSYFVQNLETDFLQPGDKNRLVANATYCYDDLKYTTMSLWCKEWLKDSYGQSALYASNGLWTERYPFKKRKFSGEKVKILIEGDPKSEWKNVDEAFRITNQLDRERFEISFLSYYAEPKDWYIVDIFHQKIPSEKVGEIYAQNDILLKTSLLESFSYPPLEMMATGGFVVVIPNGGNLEYLKDQENCLMFDSGDERKAIACIEQIVSDKTVRDRLEKNGRSLAKRYDWSSVEQQIMELYR